MGLTEFVDELGGPVIEKVASNVAEDNVNHVVEKTVEGRGDRGESDRCDHPRS